MLSVTPSYPPGSYDTDSTLDTSIVTGFTENRLKRFFDFTVALAVTVFVLSWLALVVGTAIRLTSSGPILFIQLRTGRNGRPFRCFKFRTMTHNPASMFKQATKNDTRVTRVGAFLRKSNLDEMPQFLNVLLGDMSITGPRPHAVQHDAQFWNTLDGYPDRYIVKPGITGLAQVRGCRGETDTLMKMQHRLRLDRFYIQKQSPLLDAAICWWTIEKVIMGDEKAH